VCNAKSLGDHLLVFLIHHLFGNSVLSATLGMNKSKQNILRISRDAGRWPLKQIKTLVSSTQELKTLRNCKFATGVNDTSGKFGAGINDTGTKFVTCVNDTGGK
jgi:hypothetical protein